MKKLLVSAALLAMAGTSSAFNGPTTSGIILPNTDVAGIPILVGVLGGAPNGGTYVDAVTPGVTSSQAGIVLISKSGSNLVVELNSSGFAAASDSLAGLGTVDAAGNIVIVGEGLNTLAQNVGVSPSDLTVKKLTIKKAGL